MRSYDEAIKWLAEHDTEAKLGFDPDGQCLKIARLARGLGGGVPSAKKMQDATPRADRVYSVKDLRRGMVLFFDDPNDSNKYGHIVTLIGRVKGANMNSLHDCLVRTNSVQSRRTTVVRADYFSQHWGDPFQFGAKSLEGQEIDFYGQHPAKPEGKGPLLYQFTDEGPRYSVGLLDAAAHKGGVTARKARDRIDKLVVSLPHDSGPSRVNEFVAEYKKSRVLRMGLLSDAVHDGDRGGKVKDVFTEIMELVKDLPHR